MSISKQLAAQQEQADLARYRQGVDWDYLRASGFWDVEVEEVGDDWGGEGENPVEG